MIELLTAYLYRRLYMAAEIEAQQRVEEKDYGLHPIARGIIDATILVTLTMVGASWALAKAAKALTPNAVVVVRQEEKTSLFNIFAPTPPNLTHSNTTSTVTSNQSQQELTATTSFIYRPGTWQMTQDWHGTALPGKDYAAGCGTTIMAPISGIVTQNGRDKYCGPFGCYNTVLTIENSNYKITLLHGQYSVQAGTSVTAGQRVGRERSIGNSSGCHSHLSVWNKRVGLWVDPEGFE